MKRGFGVAGPAFRVLGFVALTFAAGVSGQAPSRETAARAPIDAFFKAFNARDNEALKQTLHYPHVRINESAASMSGRTRPKRGPTSTV
jgi:hypothetical protein